MFTLSSMYTFMYEKTIWQQKYYYFLKYANIFVKKCHFALFLLFLLTNRHKFL